jgi:hypothetical protein
MSELYKLAIKVKKERFDSNPYVIEKLYGSINQILNFFGNYNDSQFYESNAIITRKKTLNDFEINEVGKFKMINISLMEYIIKNELWSYKLYLYDIENERNWIAKKKIYGLKDNIFSYISQNIDIVSKLDNFKNITLKRLKCEVLI